MRRLLDYLIGTSDEMNKDFSVEVKTHVAEAFDSYKDDAWENILQKKAVRITNIHSEYQAENMIAAYSTAICVPVALVAPIVGLPFLIDNACRVAHIFHEQPPVGLVGTIREIINSKR